MNAPQVAGKSSPVSDTVLPSTTATDFDQADADHTKKEESASASGARRTRLTNAVSLLLGANRTIIQKRDADNIPFSNMRRRSST
jgi:hypothetical protein